MACKTPSLLIRDGNISRAHRQFSQFESHDIWDDPFTYEVHARKQYRVSQRQRTRCFGNESEIGSTYLACHDLDGQKKSNYDRSKWLGTMLLRSRPRIWSSCRAGQAYYHPPLISNTGVERHPGCENFETFKVPASQGLTWKWVPSVPRYLFITLFLFTWFHVSYNCWWDSLYNYKPGENRPVVVYLPAVPASLLFSCAQRGHKNMQPPIIREEFSEFCVARINWRGGKGYPFPRSYLDVRIGYKPITSHISLEGRKVGVCGKYMGGGLAMSLVLAEIKAGNRRPISALAVWNAVCIWLEWARFLCYVRLLFE